MIVQHRPRSEERWERPPQDGRRLRNEHGKMRDMVQKGYDQRHRVMGEVDLCWQRLSPSPPLHHEYFKLELPNA